MLCSCNYEVKTTHILYGLIQSYKHQPLSRVPIKKHCILKLIKTLLAAVYYNYKTHVNIDWEFNMAASMSVMLFIFDMSSQAVQASPSINVQYSYVVLMMKVCPDKRPHFLHNLTWV